DPCARIQEDHLRILRFFRFYAQLAPASYDRASLQACIDLSPCLSHLSRERIGRETLKMLASPNPYPSCALIVRHHIWKEILPDCTNLDRLSALLETETSFNAPPSALRRLAALLDAEPASTAQSLRLSKAETHHLESVMSLISHPERLTAPSTVRQTLYDDGAPATYDALLLTNKNQFDTIATWEKPIFPLRGQDVHALVPKGPKMGARLKETEKWWRSHDFTPDKNACLEHFKSLKKAPE
ncbi:MAG: CCA tRNA nucleotidyltransferase, partial [Bdellovibrionales bacterium]